jgi:hypothetical protein
MLKVKTQKAKRKMEPASFLFQVHFFWRCCMSDTLENKAEGGKWPAENGGMASAPVSTAALANAAARAAASGAKRDLLEYLRLRRKAG